jgi:hypothetical protein
MSTNGAASVATSSTNATAGVATPSTEASNDNAALIGGIVGGVVALLLIGGLIAFLVARSRRREKDHPNNDAALHSVRQSMPSNDARARENDYGAISLGPPQNYDAWSTKDDNYGKPSTNRTDYEDFTKIH